MQTFLSAAWMQAFLSAARMLHQMDIVTE